jgi:hypothetical protein
VERFGETCLFPSGCDTLEHLPPPDLRLLESRIRPAAMGKHHVPGLLAVLSSYLRSQEEHSRVVPVVQVALALRALYLQDGPVSDEVHPDEEHSVRHDVAAAIDAAMREVRASVGPKYTFVKHVPPQLLETYFTAVEGVLYARFSGADGDADSLYQALAAVMPGLVRQEYARAHRSRLEYIARMAHKRVQSALAAAYRAKSAPGGGMQRDTQ